MINPNVATIQTDTKFADKVYLLPVTPDYVNRVIEKEMPDGIMLGFGGQTALNCGVSLFDNGTIKKYGINVLGTKINSIKLSEDRQLFKDAMNVCNVPTLESKAVKSFNDAKNIANQLGYPVIIRVAYTLGGKGGGVARNEIELYEVVNRGLNASMVGQVLIEKYIGSWKQIEYEIMRDCNGNSITICNMENILAMKIHTGDNIVVAPSQTIDNYEYHLLRTAAIRAANHVDIIGECNVQFAVDVDSSKYVVIEMNPRLSRSSALASKATGYPIAYMSTKINLGYSLDELRNSITKKTTACFEPSLDYIVCKHPRWDFNKFEFASRKLGTTMKSTGEVMAIGRTFEEALQKSIRMLDINKDGLVLNKYDNEIDDEEDIENHLINPNNFILHYVATAIKKKIPIEKIAKLSSIDPWFINKIKNIVELENKLKNNKINHKLLTASKKRGFSDKQIGRAMNIDEKEVRTIRKKMNVLPVVKQIDTLSAEWPTQTNYLYLTYGGNENDFHIKNDNGIIVLGAGPYRIGSSVEFDWGTVNMVFGLQENGEKNVSIINCNPETVSTDYDVCKRLYFEELTIERILDIIEFEKPRGVITSVGGQIANNLAPILNKNKIKILGTNPKYIDQAEDRSKFSTVLDKLNISQPVWKKFSYLNESLEFAKFAGYPVIARPSYVLSGSSMKVIWSEEELKKYLEKAVVDSEHQIVISKYMVNSLEIDVDGVSDSETVIIGAIIEHVDNAGIHSGDAMMCIPTRRLSKEIVENIVSHTKKIVRELKIIGTFNIQFIVSNKTVYVIELNIRASRSMPFVAKLMKINLVKLAASAILNKSLPNIHNNIDKNTRFKFGVKIPQFSFMQLDGADITLGVEMQSTGEVACIGNDFYDAATKGLISAGYKLPKSGCAMVIIDSHNMHDNKIIKSITTLCKIGFKILTTKKIKMLLNELNENESIIELNKEYNFIELFYSKKIDLVINIPNTSSITNNKDSNEEYQIRRKALELSIPVLTTKEMIELFTNVLKWLKNNNTSIQFLDH